MEKSRLAKTNLDEQIINLVKQTDHKTLVIWALDCAERVLPYFKNFFPEDNRPQEAINAGHAWVRGELKLIDVRKAALASHAAARDTGQMLTARSAARSAGHAAATAHVPSHAIYAAAYAVTAIRDSSTEADVNKEREWQYQHLIKLGKKF